MLGSEQDHGPVRLGVESARNRLDRLLDDLGDMIVADRESLVQCIVSASGLDGV